MSEYGMRCRIKALERELDRRKEDVEDKDAIIAWTEQRLEMADEALALAWDRVSEDDREELRRESDYIEEMFWNG